VRHRPSPIPPLAVAPSFPQIIILPPFPCMFPIAIFDERSFYSFGNISLSPPLLLCVLCFVTARGSLSRRHIPQPLLLFSSPITSQFSILLWFVVKHLCVGFCPSGLYRDPPSFFLLARSADKEGKWGSSSHEFSPSKFHHILQWVILTAPGRLTPIPQTTKECYLP